MQVRFVTRSGTNKFETSLYWFQQHAKLNSNTLLQPAGRAAGAGGDQLHLRRPRRRPDRPARASTAAAGRSSSSTRKRSTARSNGAHAATIIRAVGAGRRLHLRRAGREHTVNVLALAARRASRRQRRRRSDGQVAARSDSHGRRNRRARSRTGDVAEHRGVPLPGAEQGHPAHADDEHHGQPDAEAPPAGLVLLAAVQQRRPIR